VIARYEERAARYAAAREHAARQSRRIARFRLATFLPGAALIVWGVSRGLPAIGWIGAAALLGAFAALVVWHARVDERVAWFDALHTINLYGIARITRAWERLPAAEAPARTDLTDHPYAGDLDVFGRASLMQWLGPAATAAGTATLESWLLNPADPATVRGRQGAVLELAPAHDWREEFAAHGRMTSGIRSVELQQFIAWAEGPGPFTERAAARLQILVVALLGLIWAAIALQAAGLAAGAYWLIPLLAGIILSFATGAQIHGQFTRAGAAHHAFSRYAALFRHAVAAPHGAGCLEAIRARLAAEGADAPSCMSRLNGVLGFAQLRQGAAILHFPIQAFTLWDFHVFFALDRWRRTAGRHVRDWMHALGELDALSAFARIRADAPDWAMPELVTGEPLFSAADLGHPLIPDDRRVANDVAVGPPGTILLVTGSNMSGKSTLLRAIGLNTVLAQAGAPVCARSLRMPPVALETSIHVQDSLERGLSYFMAALARLKALVDRAERATPARDRQVMLYLLDEILQGTNTAERGVAVRGVARHLLGAGAIGVMTTHDLGLAGEEPLRSSARLVHFTERIDHAGGMTFDYRLRPGLATSRNALRLMQAIGISLGDDPRESSPVLRNRPDA
jgi:hypothetical protein